MKELPSTGEEEEEEEEKEQEEKDEEEKEQRMEEEKEQRMEEEHETAEKVEREKDGGDKCSAMRSKANGEESDAPLGSLKEPQEIKGKNSWKVPLLKWVHIC